MLDRFLVEAVFFQVHTLDDILNAILPEELLDRSPSGFSATGHLGRFRPVDICWTRILIASRSSHEPER
jgi:hypothetical protein